MSLLHDRRGFTLVESMVVIGIMGVVIAVSSPAFGGYLKRNALEAMVGDAVSTLRSAQMLSQAGASDATWGVYVAGTQTVLFQGASYATRDTSFDQNVPYSSDIYPSGTVEYVFEAGTGRTQAGSFAVTNSDGETRTITVNAFGMVDF